MKSRRSIPGLLGAIACVTASLVGCGALSTTAVAATTKTVHVSTQFAEIGQLIYVTGTGWSQVGQTVEIELCGRDARDLSLDCAQDNQYTAAIRPGGIFYGALTTRIPPTPCPCVVLVVDQSGLTGGVTTPITILGAPIVPLPPQTTPPAPVALSAKVLSPTSVSSWFGGPKAVTLVIRVTNLSSIAYSSPTLTVNVGKGSNPSGFVLGRPLGPLPVGATHVLRVPVTIPAFTFGDYSVRAQVITGNGNVAVIAATSSYPWGLFALGVICVIVVGLMIWARHRRRKKSHDLPSPDGDIGASETSPQTAEVPMASSV